MEERKEKIFQINIESEEEEIYKQYQDLAKLFMRVATEINDHDLKRSGKVRNANNIEILKKTLSEMKDFLQKIRDLGKLPPLEYKKGNIVLSASEFYEIAKVVNSSKDVFKLSKNQHRVLFNYSEDKHLLFLRNIEAFEGILNVLIYQRN